MSIALYIAIGGCLALLLLLGILCVSLQGRKVLAERLLVRQEEEHREALAVQREDWEREKNFIVSQYERQLQQQRADAERSRAEQFARWQAELSALRTEFQNSACAVLEERRAVLEERNGACMKELFEPFREKLSELQNQLSASQKERASLGALVQEKLQSVQRNAERMVGETDKLTSALKGTNKLQGNWGEMQLEQALVDCGLEREVNFRMQSAIVDGQGRAYATENGERFIPDATVFFPDGRRIFLDSKTSMTAYMNFVEALDETARESALSEHLASVRNHIRSLSAKDYPARGNLAIPNSSFECTILFMGNEGALMTALTADSALWEDAFRKYRVILVSRMTLYPLLWLVRMSWRMERQTKNQQNIMEQTARLIERLGKYMDGCAVLGKKLAEAQKAYDDTMRVLNQGQQSMVRTGQRISELMGKEAKSLEV